MLFNCNNAVATVSSDFHKINDINYCQARRNGKHSDRREDASVYYKMPAAMIDWIKNI